MGKAEAVFGHLTETDPHMKVYDMDSGWCDASVDLEALLKKMGFAPAKSLDCLQQQHHEEFCSMGDWDHPAYSKQTGKGLVYAVIVAGPHRYNKVYYLGSKAAVDVVLKASLRLRNREIAKEADGDRSYKTRKCNKCE